MKDFESQAIDAGSIARPPGQRLAATAALCLSALLAGCYTTQQTITLAPLETGYPVSASGEYVDNEGQIVTENDYEVVDNFELDKVFEAPRHQTTETSFDLRPELDALVAKSQGDAITDLKIVGYEYDPGSHGSSAGLKIVGWSFGVMGASFVGLGLAIDEDPVTNGIVTMGAVFAGAGALCLLIGGVADDPSHWKFKVSGHVARRDAGADSAVETRATDTSGEAEGAAEPEEE